MKSSPIKYSFVRIANCLICFWFNIMIIQGSDVWHLKTFQALSSISHFTFRVYFSWDFLSDTWHQQQMFWQCLSSIRVVSRMWWPGGDIVSSPDLVIVREGVSQCLSRSSNSNKCVIITVWIVSTQYLFKCDPHFCVQVVVVCPVDQ